MNNKVFCSKKIWHNRGNWGDRLNCQRPVKVERNGKWYCALHDPERTQKVTK